MSVTAVLSMESRAILAPLCIQSLSDHFIRLPKALFSSRQDELLWGEFQDIPVILESIETLRFIGFTEQAASAIFHRWWVFTATNPDWEVEFFEFVAGHIRAYTEALGEDWSGVLKGMGVRKETRDRILDPEFTDFRLTHKAKDWALDMVEIRWRHVCAMDHVVKQNQARVEHRLRELEEARALASRSVCGVPE
jgi:hypothetical protein